MVQQEALIDSGLVNEDTETGDISLGKHASRRRLYQWGDALTNDNFEYFPDWLKEKTCDPYHSDMVDVLKTHSVESFLHSLRIL